MPKLDAMLKMMLEKGVERAVLRSDLPYLIFVAGRQNNGPVMSRQQLRVLLDEVVPPSLAPGLQSGNSFHFEHLSPFGAFDIRRFE